MGESKSVLVEDPRVSVRSLVLSFQSYVQEYLPILNDEASTLEADVFGFSMIYLLKQSVVIPFSQDS